MKKGIFWLASYPKSGNTWLRIFLENLLNDREGPIAINQIGRIRISSSRSVFDEQVGIESSDLTMDEIDALRPLVYEHVADNTDSPVFMKIHDAYTLNRDGRPIIPENATAGVVYIIRNPLDVAVSFAGHFGCSLDKAVSRMADSSDCLAGNDRDIAHQFRQRMMSWSDHVRSWMLSGLPVHVVRYEDMKHKPLATFGEVVRFLGMDRPEAEIRQAVEYSSFEILKNQEETSDFMERPITSSAFFRKGETGSWQKELNKHQIERTILEHGDVMQQFGYLDGNGVSISYNQHGTII